MSRKPARSAGATAAKLAMHEAVCAERYAGILQRMVRLEKIIVGAATALMSALALVAWTFISHGLIK
ncbi:MAG: hypothetical protein NTV97_20475 [Alphaproteobacteria bacterium]|nr:hypothetical protein [Alphaproteobacteria bacterium]